MHRSRNSTRRNETVLTGAALGMALIEATTAQARPMPADGARISTRNTPAPSGDMYEAGRGLLAAGDITAAMAAFRQALLETPQSIDALNGLGVCYDRLGRYDIGRSYYDTALAIDPGSTLVLNNLGYSLYLQGEYTAAIPILQRAGEAADPAIAAASQRVLAMVADRLLQAAADNGARLALAESGSQRAHIELAGNGEQRLVFGVASPDDALVASLGDAAALVVISGPARRGGDSNAIAASVDALPTVIYLSSSQQGTAHATTLVLTTDETVEPARPARIAAAPVDMAAAAIPRATPAIARTTMAEATPQQKPLALRRDNNAPINAPVILPTSAAANSRDRTSDPAWLLSSRRSDRPTTGRAAIGQDPRASAVAAFESDLVELNRFAARMRGGSIAVGEPENIVAGAASIDRDAAVARLEALIARVRTA